MTLGLRCIITLVAFAIIACILLLDTSSSSSVSAGLSHLDISDLGSGLLISGMLILR